MTFIVEPIFRAVTLRVNNEGVALPFAGRPSVPSWVGVFWQGDIVGPNFTVVVGPVERLKYFPRATLAALVDCLPATRALFRSP